MAKDFRTPLGKARGLGSAKSGTGHFWLQRVTAFANVPLFLLFIAFVVYSVGKDYRQVHAVLANPFAAVIMGLMVLGGIYHMKLGMQVIIEDYARAETPRLILLALNIFFSFAMGAACILALLKITLGG
ncbi:MAG: Succinate dehydrogenase hydrophobic membrane anchor protein [Candidatus Tokpelaia hoelldobleri]|uniref:Succinate dehydrogenase hydrophobic membrane anchor subunit n=1 Tax=Candidatus Tokpelaia hoelldobleri TaxID=1902579 RepID=A0A1U9JSC4_9HYPH|nr:MAG: Succinate dehydrogenase hydrophobic membrane anchor protein [Candidatus Tokpelaia hoelldoblerii]